MVAYDSAFFTKEFEGLSFKARAVIALRAALRVLPILSYRKNSAAEPFAYWK